MCLGPREEQCIQCNETQYYFVPLQKRCRKCLQRQYGDNDTMQCRPCHLACDVCVGPSQSQCVKCAENREGPLCQCPLGTTDHVANFATAFCGTCETVLLKSCTFTPDFTGLVVDFDTVEVEVVGWELASSSYLSPNTPSYALCRHLFNEAQFLPLLGSITANVKCSLGASPNSN